MLKSNSNQLTFENEIQNLRNQRENQFKKPTYAEIASRSKQENFPIPPLLPKIEDMQQQMNKTQYTKSSQSHPQ